MLTLDRLRRAVLPALGATALLACSAVPGLAAAPSGAGRADATAGPAGALQPGQVVTVAGFQDLAASRSGGFSGDGGPAMLARFSDNLGIAVAPDGSLLVADTGNGRTRRIGPDGTVDTIYDGTAGASAADCGKEVAGWKYCPRKNPESVAVAPDGSIYVVDTAVRRITPDGKIQTIGGEGDLDDGEADGGPATRAFVYRAKDVAVDADGNVFVADSNNRRIRKIDSRGVITTIAGGGELPAPTPGDAGQPAKSTKLTEPQSLAVDSRGTVYFATEYRGAVYAVDPGGQLRIVAGTGTEPEAGSELPAEGTPATKAELGQFVRVAVGTDDALYFVDRGVVYRLDAKGGIHVVATSVGGTISDLAVAPNGDIYVTAGETIELIVSAKRSAVPDTATRQDPADPWAGRKAGSVVTVAGSGRDAKDIPAGSNATQPAGVAVDGSGTTYVAMRGLNRVFRISRTGAVEPVAGTGTAGHAGDGGPATRARLSAPAGVAVDASGTLYIADTGNNRVRKVGRDGVISTVAGNGKPRPDGDDRPGIGTDHKPATDVRLAGPAGVAVDAKGALYIADTGDSQVHRVDPKTGILDVVAGSGTSYFEGDGGPATRAALEEPRYVAVDRSGNVYVSDSRFQSVRRIGTDGKIRTIAGTGDDTIRTGGFAGDGGRADRALLNSPTGLAVDASGALYIADSWNNRVRKVGRDGVISTVAGAGAFGSSGDGMAAVEALLGEPAAIAVTPDGDVVLADVRNHRIRKFRPGGAISLVADLEQAGRVPAGQVDLGNIGRLVVAPDGRLVVRSGPWLVPFEVSAKGSQHTTALLPGERARPAAGDLVYSGGVAYLLADNEVTRVEADGQQVRIAGGGPLALPKRGQRQPASRTGLRSPMTLVAGPDGSVYFADRDARAVYRITADGMLGLVAPLPKKDLWPAFAVDGQGHLYGTVMHGIVRIAPDGTETFVAGRPDDEVDHSDDDADIGDGGAATKARIGEVRALVLDRDGTLYFSEEAGIRRVSPDGTIMTVVPAGDGSASDALALDRHGNLYFTDDSERVQVVVRPGELEPPSRTGPWLLTAAIGAPAALVVAVGAVVVVRRKQRGSADETPAG